MNEKLGLIVQYCKEQIGGCYVWGATGQNATDIDEDWIRGKESSCTNPYDGDGRLYADIAVERWQEKLYNGEDNFKVYDCSGLIDSALIFAEVIAQGKRYDCDSLWERCTPIPEPIDGCLVFRVDKSDADDETHVGLYCDGDVIHAKGRSDGVVCEPYDPEYWDKAGMWTALYEAETTNAQEPTESTSHRHVTIVHRDGEVRVRLAPVDGETIYITKKKGEKLDYLEETDPDTGWHKVNTKCGVGWITGKPKYTVLEG